VLESFVVVTQDRFLKMVNTRVLSMSGYSEQELTSGSFFELVHPDDRAMVMAFHVTAQEVLSAATKRMGIRSMQERVNLLQGLMTIQSQPMKGTKIYIKIPL
jgi:PAS domain S-box-containing protein